MRRLMEIHHFGGRFALPMLAFKIHSVEINKSGSYCSIVTIINLCGFKRRCAHTLKCYTSYLKSVYYKQATKGSLVNSLYYLSYRPAQSFTPIVRP